ncbi:metallophosphoesterase family protein [Fredinandcohnia sp. 179-A 10B2 NHS]|uniref:metallophosphoesterase family protein n=1 Tax=Fredinandcohnia sp. 179-A 10B2 NHS TaxID=3235176 RepID=UPI0039A01922
MKLAFISDIHGNAVAFEAVLQDIEKKNIEKVYVLGDLCFRGPEPKSSLDLVRSLHTEVIKGNADEWLVRGVRKGEVPDQALEIMNLERNWAFSQLSEEDIDYLEKLPTSLSLEFEGKKINAFHATPDSLFEIVLPSEADQIVQNTLIKDTEADIYIYAHIHKPYIKFINGKCIINTGSVGLPFDGLAQSSYAMIDIQDKAIQATIVRVPYDVEKVKKQYTETNYPNKELLINIIQNGELPK